MAIEFEIQDSNSLEFSITDPQNLEFDTRDVVEVRQSGDYAFTYDESVSAGSAVVGEAVTGEPNYTPSGTVTGTVTTKAETFLSGGTVSFVTNYANYKLYFNTPTFDPVTTTKNLVTGIENLSFNGNGVKVVVEQEQ